MRTFLAILLIATLAMLMSSTLGFRLRRSRVSAALLGGGWLAIAAGAAIGPHALGVVTAETLRGATPLVALGLGWIGLMIGLQAQRRVLVSLPGRVVRFWALDALATALVIGTIAWLGLSWWVGLEGRALVLTSALVAFGAMGWTLETRSLAAGDELEWREGTLLIRGAGGLAGITSLLGFGAVFAFTHRVESSELGAMVLGELRLLVAAALALVAGLIGRFALREARGTRAATLTAALGLVALVGGLAFELQLSPLLIACLAGAVIANLGGEELRSFERTILKAEHTVAAIFALLAGALLDPAIGWGGTLLAAAIAGGRLALKPLTLRLAAGGSSRPGALGWAVVRQSPVAVALAVGVVVAATHESGQRLLTVIVLAGLLAELLPLAAVWALRRDPMGTPVEPEKKVQEKTAEKSAERSQEKARRRGEDRAGEAGGPA